MFDNDQNWKSPVETTCFNGWLAKIHEEMALEDLFPKVHEYGLYVEQVLPHEVWLMV